MSRRPAAASGSNTGSGASGRAGVAVASRFANVLIGMAPPSRANSGNSSYGDVTDCVVGPITWAPVNTLVQPPAGKYTDRAAAVSALTPVVKGATSRSGP